jgi:hypothetical protein
MSESIPVEARFEPDGSLRPLAFEWQEKRYQVESQGRQWEENRIQHFLVMVSGDQVFELAYFLDMNQWQVIRSPIDFQPTNRI